MIVPAVSPVEKETLLAYLGFKIDVAPAVLVGQMPYEIVAVVRDGKGMGAVLYTNYRTTSIEVVWAGEPGWLTRTDLRVIFAYPFLQLGCLRAFGIVKRTNRASRKLAARLGCREVGVLEDEYGTGIDGVLYSITRAKCRWIGPGTSCKFQGVQPIGEK